jgi:hypothetical protein
MKCATLSTASSSFCCYPERRRLCRFAVPRTMAFRNPTNYRQEDRRFDWRRKLPSATPERLWTRVDERSRSYALCLNNGQRAVPDDEDPEQNMKERAREVSPRRILRYCGSLYCHWKLWCIRRHVGKRHYYRFLTLLCSHYLLLSL